MITDEYVLPDGSAVLVDHRSDYSGSVYVRGANGSEVKIEGEVLLALAPALIEEVVKRVRQGYWRRR